MTKELDKLIDKYSEQQQAQVDYFYELVKKRHELTKEMERILDRHTLPLSARQTKPEELNGDDRVMYYAMSEELHKIETKLLILMK